jgi:hypothetical protein
MKLPNLLKSIFFFLIGTIFLTLIIIYPGANGWSIALPLGNNIGITLTDIIIYLSFLIGIFYLYKWTASVLRNKKSSKTKRIISIILLFISIIGFLIFLGLTIIQTFYQTSQIKYQAIDDGKTIKYEDHKFGYEFYYPSNWKKNSNSDYPGYVEIVSNSNPQTTIAFWYKDSKKIINVNELYNFVAEDAKYDNEHNNSKTSSIDKMKDINAVLWKFINSEGNNYEQYYFFDPSIIESNIYVWTLGIISKTGQTLKDKEDAQSVLNSYKLID